MAAEDFSGEAEWLTHTLAAVARREDDAFAVLYTALLPQVLGVARRAVGDHATAEEVAQEVITELWSTAGRYRSSRGSVRGWASMIARRRAVDRVRRRTAALHREQRAFDLAWMPAYDSVYEQVADQLTAEAVRRCLTGLTHLQGEAVRLVFYENCGYREAAQRLGIPLGTVKSRVHDGLARLRTEVQRDWTDAAS